MGEWAPREAAPGDVDLPAVVVGIAAGRPVHPLWRNDHGGLTCLVGTGDEAVVVKWSPPGGPELAAEVARLRWASSSAVTVPAVLAVGDGWFTSAVIPGRNAVEPRWRAEPGRAARAIGQGLRALHDALPVDGCPFTWSAPERAARADRLDPASWHPDHRHLTLPEALARLVEPPDPDRLVVCQGDACAPNTLLHDDGSVAGHVDLGALGVADRWADLAVATWSTVWNYGPGHEVELLEAYGVEPDPERTAYYRLLWELVD